MLNDCIYVISALCFKRHKKKCLLLQLHILQLHKMQNFYNNLTGDQKAYINLCVGMELQLLDHIPIKEVMLIVCDYATPISPNKAKAWGKCEHCNAKHRRQQSNLCMSCKTICLICKSLDANEKSLVCFSCMVRLPEHKTRALAVSQTPKHIMYRELFCIQFASEIHYQAVEIDKRRAAVEQENKVKELAFLKAEDAKPKDQQIAELRKKLYAANDQLRKYDYDPKIPKFSYY